MDAPEYEEAFEEYEQPSKLPWILFAVAAIAAVTFGVLWYLRGGELSRRATELQTAQAAAAAAEERVQQGADAAQTAAGENAARITELENSLRTAQAQAAAASPSDTFQTTLAEMETLRGQLTDAQGRITELESAITANRQELEAAAEQASATERARAALETQYAAAQTQLAEAQNQATASAAAAASDAGSVAAAATAATAETEARMAQLEKRATDAEKTLADAGTSLTALEKQVKDLEAVRDNLTKELATATTARNTFQKAAEDAKTLAKTADENRRAREKELLDSAAKQKAEFQKQLEAAKAAQAEAPKADAPKPDAPKAEEKPETAKPAATAPATVVPATSEWAYVEEDEKTGTPAAEQPKHVLIGNPNRAVGQVVQALTDGVTFVINGGANQRVRPGMVFDVHRRFGGMSRYIGLLLVTRVLDDYSLAVPAYPTREARICPVTGRVVLDPTRDTSPFVEVEGGKPVPLIPAASVGLGREMPAIGDCIDNPYYDPAGSMVFSVGADVKDNTRIPALVEGVGGVTGDSVEADFEIAASSDAKTQPVKTAVDALSMYFVPPAKPATAATAK